VVVGAVEGCGVAVAVLIGAVEGCGVAPGAAVGAVEPGGGTEGVVIGAVDGCGKAGGVEVAAVDGCTADGVAAVGAVLGGAVVGESVPPVAGAGAEERACCAKAAVVATTRLSVARIPAASQADRRWVLGISMVYSSETREEHFIDRPIPPRVRRELEHVP
jgi:hypothetical protein